MKTPPRRRFRDVLAAWAQAVYRRPWLLAILPFVAFLPLLDQRGLYEYGDANFPLSPYWLDYILPWSGAASAGADNTFIGVPRLVNHVGINLLIAISPNLQTAQWIWYSSMTVVGLIGAYYLARRLGAGLFSVPLAIFYAMNLWSYDRIAQGPIYLSYQAMPLVIYLFLRYLKRPRVSEALYFACSLLFIIPALQISYLAALVCLAIAVREFALRGTAVLKPLAWLMLAVVAANAFYVFSMVADTAFDAGGNIALVNQRFGIGTFQYYSTNVSVFNTLTLQSFFYSSIGRQLSVVRAGVLLIPLLWVSLLILMRRPTLRSKFYAGLALSLFGVWLVAGIAIAPNLYQWFHYVVPGMRSFVEPDYFSPLYILGVFVMLATALRLGARAYGPLWGAAVWILGLSGTFAFMPLNGPASGLPQTGQPWQYTAFSRSKVQGSTLWLPPVRGVQYRWSPYVLNGYTSLNSPSDAVGPTMAEWVAPGTARVQDRLAQGFEAGQVRTVEAIAPLLGVGTVAIAADSTSEDQTWPNPKIDSALATADALQTRHFFVATKTYREDLVHLVTARTTPPLPEIGLYGLPLDAGRFDDFMWRLLLSRRGPYVPIAADGIARSLAQRVGAPLLPSPALSRMTISGSSFRRYDDCGPKAPALRMPRNGSEVTIRTELEPRCLTIAVPHAARMLAMQAVLDAQPPDVAALKIVFHKRPHDVDWIDPSLPAQEIPLGTRAASLIVRVVPGQTVTVKALYLAFAKRPLPAIAPPAATCSASDVTWSERNPMEYTVDGNVHGTCTLIFRQSFAPIWSVLARGAGAAVLGHLQVDGFANAWVVRASGPVRFTILNRALYAYIAGLTLTVACVLLALSLAIRARVKWSARRASRLPSTA